jgi:hypothetical protein
MPAKSQAQARLMAAAEHGATFPLAQSIRSEMTKSQLHDFAATPRKGLPVHVPKTHTPKASRPVLSHPHKNLGPFLHPPKRSR